VTAKRETKKTRGAQIGNQNARKHGFYSVALTLREICEFWRAVHLGGHEPEVTVLRIKLDSALRYAPGNRRVLREASRLLAKWYRTRYHLTGEDNTLFKKLIRNILEAACKKSMDFAGTNRACSDKKLMKIPERIEAEIHR